MSRGYALDGIEFCYEDATSQLFGKRGGKPGGDEFVLDTRRGEILLGFYVRAGLWIDGIEILTSLGRKSGVYGNAAGGTGYVFSFILSQHSKHANRLETVTL